MIDTIFLNCFGCDRRDTFQIKTLLLVKSPIQTLNLTMSRFGSTDGVIFLTHFLSHSMSEYDSSDQAVSVVVVVSVNIFSFSTSHKTAGRICFKFCVDVPLVDPY